jgi:site-specific DNA-methyltransferase (adenine-specific)
MPNAFYFGDNLHVLREYIADRSVDLIYLDPPFNSNANYNLLFKSPDRKRWSDAQIATFEDTWSWGDLADAQFRETVAAGGKPAEVLTALHRILGQNDMLAYLTMMTARLVELRRVLKATGSLYLHCDPTASHYLKVVLDGVFGPAQFRNDITWKRTSSHGDSRTWSRVADNILFYTASDEFTWNIPREEYQAGYLSSKYRHDDGDGRLYQLDNMTSPNPRPNMTYEWRGFPPPQAGWRYSLETMSRLDHEGRIWYPTRPDGTHDHTRRPRLKRYLGEMAGPVRGAIWTDIAPLNSQARERLGYPTQKPLALLERILAASSREGDVILDPFCGCGTALHAAEKHGRSWVGIDVAVQAMQVVGDRLREAFPAIRYDVFGLPADADSALWLAARDPFKFEEWACSRIGAMHSGRYRNDGGIDGTFFFLHGRDAPSRGIVSVKAGRNLNPGMVRDLVGTLQRERRMASSPHDIAVLVTAHQPTSGMLDEARKAGKVETLHGEISAVQILSVADIFAGRTVQVPLMLNTVTAAAQGRRKGREAAYIDPREIFRQRQMLFSFAGTQATSARPQVMPEQRQRTA